MSSATLPPWLSPWSTGLVYGERVYKVNERVRPPLERSRHRPRLTIYTYGHGNNAPILSSWSEDGSGAGPGAAAGGAGGAVAGGGGAGGTASEAPPPAVRWERVPLNHEPWHVDVPVPIQPRLDRTQRYDVTGHSELEWEAGGGGAKGGGGGAGAAEALHAWTGVLRGWAAGATLLALLFILVRVGERLLDRKIHLLRARGSQSPPPPPNEDEGSVELPPPYTCQEPKAEATRAEPPPPYADCPQLLDKRQQAVLLFTRETHRRLAQARASPPAPAPAPAARPPLSAEDAASTARLARDLDFLLRDLGINFSDLPPPPASVLRMHDEYTRMQQEDERTPPPRALIMHCELTVTREPTPTPLPVLDATNSPPTVEEVAPNPTDAVAPNEAGGGSRGPPQEVVWSVVRGGVDPAAVRDVAADESVVV